MVSVSPRVERLTSRVPSAFSSWLMRLVTTDGATPSSRAAAEKLSSRATSRNAFRFSRLLM
jgi:hypothetical protein